jgi:hypothetical protein
MRTATGKVRRQRRAQWCVTGGRASRIFKKFMGE